MKSLLEQLDAVYSYSRKKGKVIAHLWYDNEGIIYQLGSPVEPVVEDIELNHAALHFDVQKNRHLVPDMPRGELTGALFDAMEYLLRCIESYFNFPDYSDHVNVSKAIPVQRSDILDQN